MQITSSSCTSTALTVTSPGWQVQLRVYSSYQRAWYLRGSKAHQMAWQQDTHSDVGGSRWPPGDGRVVSKPFSFFTLNCLIGPGGNWKLKSNPESLFLIRNLGINLCLVQTHNYNRVTGPRVRGWRVRGSHIYGRYFGMLIALHTEIKPFRFPEWKAHPSQGPQLVWLTISAIPLTWHSVVKSYGYTVSQSQRRLVICNIVILYLAPMNKKSAVGKWPAYLFQTITLVRM